MLRPDYTSIEYQANTRLMDLAEEIANTRKSKRDRLVDKAATIRYYLKAVELKTIYLEDAQVNNIYECLIDAADINEFPTVPLLDPADVPSIGTTIIVEGTPGERGADGGATDFSQVSVSIDTVIDSFAVTDAYGARWDYVVYDGTNQRAGSITTTWTSDGATVASPAHFSSTDIGDTSGIELNVEYFSGDIRLVADVTSGTWTVVGSRYLIPNNGSFQGVSGGSSSLADGQIFIGNSSNLAQAQPVSGDVTLSNAGVVAIASGVIVNADINGSAAIAVSKLAALTATKVAVTDSSGYLTTSAVTPTELSYLTGVTSNIQTQLDSKLSAATGAISTVVSSDLTINRAVISNGSGKIAASSVTSTELGYVSGVTSAIQTQIDTKRAKLITANRQTATYTLVLGDADKIIEMNIGSSNDLIVPPNSSVAFPIGTQILVSQYGAGATTIVAGSGVTLRSEDGMLDIRYQYCGVALIKIATDEWYVFGALA